MDNVYSVKHSNGNSYDVPTPHHHDDHPEHRFKDHLLDVLKSMVSGVAGGYILHFSLKGRR
jgi:hypothetical protein